MKQSQSGAKFSVDTETSGYMTISVAKPKEPILIIGRDNTITFKGEVIDTTEEFIEKLTKFFNGVSFVEKVSKDLAIEDLHKKAVPHYFSVETIEEEGMYVSLENARDTIKNIYDKDR